MTISDRLRQLDERAGVGTRRLTPKTLAVLGDVCIGAGVAQFAFGIHYLLESSELGFADMAGGTFVLVVGVAMLRR